MIVIIPIGVILVGALFVVAGFLVPQYLFRCLTFGVGFIYAGGALLRARKSVMKWRYLVTDGDSKKVKESSYEYPNQAGAMRAGTEYVTRHKPATTGGWSVTVQEET
jgi:hypothetical protein